MFWVINNKEMINRTIKFVWEIMYATPEEISKSKNLKDILSHYSESEKIPVRLLELGDAREPGYILVVGEGALYPWEKGQLVYVGFVEALICELEYRRELRLKGRDVPENLVFSVYDTIVPLKSGHSLVEKDDTRYSGYVTVEFYEMLAKLNN